jgi:hypothetical protein
MAVSQNKGPAKRAARNSSSPESPNQTQQQCPARLRQIQYRSYQVDIQICHFRADYISVPDFRKLLNRQRDGYIDNLFGTDTLAVEQFVPTGDELPVGCIEVAYLSGVFPKTNKPTTAGSALGFRVGNRKIEWFCFDRSILASILNSWVWDTSIHDLRVVQIVEPNIHHKIFDIVALVDKGLKERRVKGANAEHKQWHDSLWDAKRRPVKLKLTWKNFEAEYQKHQEKLRAKMERRRDSGVLQSDEQNSDEFDGEEYDSGNEEDCGS